jgi:uncharacterized membrane protein
MSGLASNGPSNKTSRSASGSRSTSAARLSLRQSTIPYTAVQAIDHLSVVCCDLAVRPLGTKIINGPGGKGHVVIPGNTFADYMYFIGGLFGRYGSGDLTVMLALLRLFETVVEVLPPGSPRLAVLDRVASEALADAERSMPRPPSLERVRAAVAALRNKIDSKAIRVVEGT